MSAGLVTGAAGGIGAAVCRRLADAGAPVALLDRDPEAIAAAADALRARGATAVAVTRCLGLELADRGVRANVVCPGSTDTPMLDAMGDLPADHAALVRGSAETFKLGIPLGRVAAPEDVAEVVAFLASPAARHVPLQTVYVDGGASRGP